MGSHADELVLCMRLRSTVSEVPGVTGQLSRGFEFQGAILHK
jgi:hypothetical protein